MNRQMMVIRVLLLYLLLAISTMEALRNAVRGKKCAQNQVVNKLTVYEDGAIEAECGPLPCGQTGICSEDASTCKAASEIFSGMNWARNGQSLLLRCCSLQASNKVYIGTDLVTLGSYYTGGLVPEKDMMGSASGVEYDFVANVRTEQGGVRVWVYRIVCQTANANQQQPQNQQHSQIGLPEAQSETKHQQQEEIKFAEVQDAQVEVEQQQQQPQGGGVEGGAAEVQDQQTSAQNPLQYRPKRNWRMLEPAVNRVL